MTKSPKNVVVSAIVGMVFLLSIIATPSAVQERGYKEMVIAGGIDLRNREKDRCDSHKGRNVDYPLERSYHEQGQKGVYAQIFD